VDDYRARLDPRFRNRVLESRDPLRFHRLLVAVVFRNSCEQLHGSHAGVGGTPDGHVNAAVVDRMCAEELGHGAT